MTLVVADAAMADHPRANTSPSARRREQPFDHPPAGSAPLRSCAVRRADLSAVHPLAPAPPSTAGSSRRRRGSTTPRSRFSPGARCAALGARAPACAAPCRDGARRLLSRWSPVVWHRLVVG
ncbi:hypothetical protein QJS66_07410 [Kocuria rhizophila]|nr:hypothetical protein QJS66_07410 [Kocuria rhizophila]